MVQFNITYDVANSPDYNALNDAERQTILDTLTAAAIWWTRYLASVNVTLDMSIYIDAAPFGAGTLALGGPDLFLNGELDEGVPVWEPVTQTKVATGVDPNGADADLAIWLSPDATHENFYFAPLDVDGIYRVPIGMIDAMSVFLHEIGHGLGFISFSDSFVDPTFQTERTTYDKFIQTSSGVAFVGPTAGAVRLQDNSISHTSESLLQHDLMSPQVGAQEIARITATDVAIMRDYGMPMRGPTSGDDVLYGFQQIDVQITGADTISAGAGNDIVHGLTGNDILFGGAGNDQLYGDHNNDQLSGDDGNDILDGGPGNDTINGGGGLDVVRYTTGERADYSVVKVGTSWFVDGPEGSDTLTGVEQIQFSNQTLYVALPPVSDFSGEGRADFLWSVDDGRAAIWLMNGTTITFGDVVGPNPGPTWHIKSTGDFNGDGKADILWQTDAGIAAVWEMSGTQVIYGDIIGPNPGPTWHVITCADFNGDNKADVLWQTDTGQAAIWLMNGTQLLFGDISGPNAGPQWHIISSGDFNNDGKSDILWQHDDGRAAIWLMNGTQVLFGDVVGPNPGPTWHIKSSGDFNGDGKSDILWQTDTGIAAIWLMNGTQVSFGDIVGPNPGPTWHIKGAADLNADGKSDIIWQTDTGLAAAWLINGTMVTFGDIIPPNPGTSWHLIAPTG
ncbi:MAG: FG-GAP-like repeat-containing protein [Alphaproteobacteria bacterium]